MARWWSRVTAIGRGANARPPSLSVTSAWVVSVCGDVFPPVAVDEVREPDATFPIDPSGVVVVGPMGVIRSNPVVAVAGVEVAHASDVFVVVNPVVTGLVLLEPV